MQLLWISSLLIFVSGYDSDYACSFYGDKSLKACLITTSDSGFSARSPSKPYKKPPIQSFYGCQKILFNCSGAIYLDESKLVGDQCKNIWLIKGDLSHEISLDFKYNANRDDVLTIYDGDSLNSPLLATFSGDKNYVSPITSYGSALTLLFSDSSAAEKFHGTCVQHEKTTESTVCQPRYFYASDKESIDSGDYNPKWTNCTYSIRMRKNQVKLKFSQFNLSAGRNMMFAKDDVGKIGTFTGSSPIADIVSTHNLLNITTSLWSKNYTFDYYLHFQEVQDACICSNTTGVSWSGHLSLPFYPYQQYCNSMSCYYRITVQDSCVVKISFDDFKLAKGDTLSIYDGREIGDWSFIAEITGAILPPHSIKSQSNVMTLVFTSDSDYVSTGFNIRYEASCGMTMTNVIGLIAGLVIFVLLFGTALCFCFNQYQKRRRGLAEELRRHGFGSTESLNDPRSPASNANVRVSVTSPNGQTLMELSIAASPPPAYEIALSLPICTVPNTAPRRGENEPEPPSYETVIKADHDARRPANSGSQVDVAQASSSGLALMQRNDSAADPISV